MEPFNRMPGGSLAGYGVIRCWGQARRSVLGLVVAALIDAAHWWNNFTMPSTLGDLDSFSRLVDGLGELEVTIGPQARPIVVQVRGKLAEAAELRRNGDVIAAIGKIR